MLARLNRFRRPEFWLSIGVGVIGIICLIDYLSGNEISLSLFYIIPIAIVTWKTNQRSGIILALISAIAWLSADLLAGNLYSSNLIFVWNVSTRFGIFIITVYLVSTLTKALDREMELSRIDSTTGAYNDQYFKVLLQMEIDRARRYECPVTVAYIDVENFKIVKDLLGRSVGNLVLRKVAATIMANLRQTDIVARLGGDEFAILLPETNLYSAESLLPRIRSGLSREMKQMKWPLTFSIGVISCSDQPTTVDDIINRSTYAMYSVKKQSSEAIQHISCSE